jgi:signal transduction histidine kinase
VKPRHIPAKSRSPGFFTRLNHRWRPSFTHVFLASNLPWRLPKRVLPQRWLIQRTYWIVLIAFIAMILFMFHKTWTATIDSIPTVAILAFILAPTVIVAGKTFKYLYHQAHPAVGQGDACTNDCHYRIAFQHLSRGFSAPGEADPDFTVLLHAIKLLLDVQFVTLLLRDQTRQNHRPTHNVIGAICLEGKAMLAAWNYHQEQAVDSLLLKHSVTLIPMRSDDLMVGYLCVGPKVSGAPFRPVDHDLLLTYSNQIALIVRNKQLTADLQMQVSMLNALYEQLERTQEEERVWLSSEIHDEALQTATHLHRQLVLSANSNPTIRQMSLVSQTVIDQLRRVCMAMRPVALDELGLIAALDMLAQEQSNHMSVPIVFEVNSSTAELAVPPKSELALYRTTQEALNNSLRHGQASHIKISLDFRVDHIELMVTDNGQGFVVPEHFKSLITQGRLGLVGMHERICRIGGQIEITSQPGEGTVIHVTIPLERSA